MRSSGRVYEMNARNESLQKEIHAKEREIRKLTQDLQQYEQTVTSLRNELSHSKYHQTNVSTRDVEVMAGVSRVGAECGDWEPVKDFKIALCEEMVAYQERIQQMEESLKARVCDVRSLRAVNVSLREEVCALRGACAALLEQARVAAQCADFKDDLVREMRRQLKHAKAQCKEATELMKSPRVGRCGRVERVQTDEDSCVAIACERRTRASRSSGDRRSLSDCRSPRLIVSGDEFIPVD